MAHYPPVVRDLFNRMSYDSQSMEDRAVLLVPKLQTFSLEIIFAPDGEILPKMIQSRWIPMKTITTVQKVASFQSVRLSIHRKTDLEQFESMEGW